LRQWIIQIVPKICAISQLEVLGYHRLPDLEKASLEKLFSGLEIVYPTPQTFDLAIQLRQQHKMSLGDALIAATCLECSLTLATHNTSDFNWISQLNVIDPLLV